MTGRTTGRTTVPAGFRSAVLHLVPRIVDQIKTRLVLPRVEFVCLDEDASLPHLARSNLD